MEVLNFRLLSVLTESFTTKEKLEAYIRQYKETLKQRVESCGLQEASVNILKVKKTEDEDYPEIEELIFDVNAKIKSLKNRKYDLYQEFLKKWNVLCTNALLYPAPVVILHESDSFMRYERRSGHHINYFSNIAFGILPYNGEFHELVKPSGSGHVDFYHDTSSVKITISKHEFSFSYNNIRNIFINIDSEPREIFFDLCNPPLLFYVEQKVTREGQRYVINHRATYPEDANDKFGRSNVIRLPLTNVKIADEIISRIHFRCGKKPMLFTHITTIPKVEKPSDVRLNIPHFGCLYLLNAIFKRNFTMVLQTKDIGASMQDIIRVCSKNPDALEKALTLVLAAVDAGKIVNYWHAAQEQFKYYEVNRDEINFGHYVVPEKCRVIRRVTLTPTRQLFWAPEIMLSNRVLRNYDSEYALRVSFRDDNNSRLSFIAAYAKEDIFDFSIRRPMSTGIQIGQRCYEFLAWSNSQIRDHGIWMYAQDQQGNTVRKIRSWMGDFSHIRSVPKYMARMGQCFSQTEDAVSVPLGGNSVRTEKDIKGGYDIMNGKPYCFSDGVGKISLKLAKQVHEAIGHDKLCSAFQIRYGGCKGMLVIDPTLKDYDIVFRESMKKFDSPQNTRLEIAKTSAPISLQLNRPFITILNEMGVRHRTFMQLQEDMLKKLTDMLFEEEKAAAFLESKTPNDLFAYQELSKSGVYLTTEPFFRSLLLALHRHFVEKIKSRANIAIDPSQGRNMLGVIDEYGVLNEGEVFVQYTKDISRGETTRETEILKSRKVLVTKNPCLLPGDVRKFKAVDVPQLRHIVDCIVFPQKGSRPHPNEMAGSDLDGDEYAVLWNDDLIFYRENAAPGHFPSAPESEKPHITERDMIEFLVTYIKNDQVGTIANAHLAHADADGIFYSKCIQIANKFSYAVDYAKTGVSKSLDRLERPEKYPDFMEKTHKESYSSKKALGKIYRCAKDYESENQQASLSYYDIKVDDDLKYPGWEKYIESAIKSRNKYNTLLKTVLRNYGIQHEAEVFSGAFNNLHYRFHERKDRDEIEKVVVRCIKRLTKSFNEEFHEEFKEKTNIKNIDVTVLQKASAWYVVTYDDKDAKFLSFPWTVSRYLALIKCSQNKSGPAIVSPIVAKMDQRIEECDSKKLLPYLLEYDIPRGYDITCGDPNIVQLALRVMILWAREQEVIQKPGHDASGLMFTKTFINLFYHVAELAKYVVKTGEIFYPEKRKHYTPASLCIDFFRFCLKLRFYNKYEVADIVPFQLYKHSNLSKRAVVSFHAFAVLGKFQTLYFDPVSSSENEIEMKPIQIESKIFLKTNIPPDTLEKARNALEKYSQAEVSLREILQTKKIVVDAKGTETALKTLKSLLRKKHVYLRQLFTTGILPAE